jgi:acetylornithine deacetylase/succinyl-diaminopimelate desuccinylase-like protein
MIFAHLEAIREMILREKTFERDIFWIFPHDEEIGGKAIQAAAKVLQSEYNIGENGFEFIVDEGTPATNKLVPGLKDIWFLTMGYTAKGRALI